MPRSHIIVTGRVQCVGFRHYTFRQAQRFAIAGWVRNRHDGSVEIEAQGDENQILEFIRAVERGPAFAFVSDLKETRLEELELETNDFRIR